MVGPHFFSTSVAALKPVIFIGSAKGTVTAEFPAGTFRNESDAMEMQTSTLF